MTDNERPAGGGNGVPGGDDEPSLESSPAAGLRQVAPALPERIDASPEDIEAGVGKLVLTLIEFLRQVLEHQAVRRMEGGGLTDEEMERLGLALMRLEERLDEIRDTFGIDRDDLNIDLGPLGQLL